jgi:hypothetical protein
LALNEKWVVVGVVVVVVVVVAEAGKRMSEEI